MEINKIFKGDSIEVLKKIPSESVDFIFADPPYYMQMEQNLMVLKMNGINLRIFKIMIILVKNGWVSVEEF